MSDQIVMLPTPADVIAERERSNVVLLERAKSDAQRVAMIDQMFGGYGMKADTDRMAVYIDQLREIQSNGTVDSGIRAAMRESGDYPPGPGHVYMACRGVQKQRPPDVVPQSAAQMAATAGIDLKAEGATWGEVFRLATELRTTKKTSDLFPFDAYWARLPSQIAACIKLGREWPLSFEQERRYDEVMREAMAKGRRAGWWFGEKRKAATPRWIGWRK